MEEKMHPAEYMKKPYGRLVVPAADGTYSAEIFEFPGCIAVGGTEAEALANLEEVALDWIAAALSQGQTIPEPMDGAEYSGKLVLRMPRGLHRRAAMCAEREGVSLNQFMVSCLAEAVGEKSKQQFVYPALQIHAVNVTFQVTRASSTLPGLGTQIPTAGARLAWPLEWHESERQHA
jgi:predicted RNase H-like HicB family nuclease